VKLKDENVGVCIIDHWREVKNQVGIVKNGNMKHPERPNINCHIIKKMEQDRRIGNHRRIENHHRTGNHRRIGNHHRIGKIKKIEYDL
jgi:hypothetical protein